MRFKKPARAAPPEAHESLIGPKTVEEEPLTGLSFRLRQERSPNSSTTRPRDRPASRSPAATPTAAAGARRSPSPSTTGSSPSTSTATERPPSSRAEKAATPLPHPAGQSRPSPSAPTACASPRSSGTTNRGCASATSRPAIGSTPRCTTATLAVARRAATTVPAWRSGPGRRGIRRRTAPPGVRVPVPFPTLRADRLRPKL